METITKPQVDKMQPIQVAVRTSPELRTKLKMMAIRRNITLNNLLLEYINDGLVRDEKSFE